MQFKKSMPISTKLTCRTKHIWVKGIQNFSIDGLRLFPRADNYEIAKIHGLNFIIFFSRTTVPISTKLGTAHPWVIGILSSYSKWRKLQNSENTLTKFKSLSLVFCQVSDVAHRTLV